MLNGASPVLIFQVGILSQGISDLVAKIPVVSQIPTVIDQPPIPIYLSEQLTGLLIDSESKNIDIETDTEGKTDASEPDVAQKPIGSFITINITAKKNSLGLILLSALMDVVYSKAAAKTYAITYLSGPITIFRGKLKSFAIDQTANNDLASIKIELTKGEATPVKTETLAPVPAITEAVTLG